MFNHSRLQRIDKATKPALPPVRHVGIQRRAENTELERERPEPLSRGRRVTQRRRIFDPNDLTSQRRVTRAVEPGDQDNVSINIEQPEPLTDVQVALDSIDPAMESQLPPQ